MKSLLLLGAMTFAASAAHAAQSPTDAEPAVVTSPTAAVPANTPTATGAPNTPAATTPPATRPRSAAAAPPPANAPGTQPPAGTRQPAQGTASGTDRVELGTTQITGNAELPRVMYVVPWKRTELGDLSGKPAKSLLDEVLAPVDRDVFQRQNRYYDALRPDAPATAPQGEK